MSPSATWLKCSFLPEDMFANPELRPLTIGGWSMEGEPAPQTFAGAIRTFLARRKLDALDKDFSYKPAAPGSDPSLDTLMKVLGIPDKPEGFQFFGPLRLSATGGLLFALPRFVVRDEENLLSTLVPGGQANHVSDVSESLDFMGTPLTGVDYEERYIDTETLCSLLIKSLLDSPSGQTSSVVRDLALRPARSVLRGQAELRERRNGHARGAGGAPEDKMLFSRSFIRFREAILDGQLSRGGFAGYLRNDPAYECGPSLEGTTRLGGEGRFACLTIEDMNPPVPPEIEQAKRAAILSASCLDGILLYLATPTLFDDGWRPPFGPDEGVKLSAAAVGRPIAFGGWDLKKRSPKPIRSAVPAGSVYYYRIEDASKARQFIEDYHFNQSVSASSRISAVRDVESRLGYGMALFGAWNPDRKEPQDL